MSWKWNPRKYDAVRLLANTRLTGDEVAARCGVNPRTIDTWRSHPEFQAEVDKQRAAWRERVAKDGIADPLRRVYRQNDRWRRMQAVIEARSKDPAMHTPSGIANGGPTGMVCRTFKKVGERYELFQPPPDEKGKRQKPYMRLVDNIVEEWAFDRSLPECLLHTEEQAARELGQRRKDEQAAKQVIIVIPRGIPPSDRRVAEVPPEEPQLDLPGGVVIDLAPVR